MRTIPATFQRGATLYRLVSLTGSTAKYQPIGDGCRCNLEVREIVAPAQRQKKGQR